MKAAVLTAHNAPLAVENVEPCELDFGQVLVKVEASGICGAQLQEIRGEKGGPLPHLLGHEGCGTVLAVGVGVSRVGVGQRVVMHWRQAAGINSQFPRYRFRKQEITSGLVTTFAEQSICSENRLTPVPDNTPAELCALLGCGLSTALGTIEHDANLKFGESVLIIGCGGLGTNLIRAASMRCASEIAVLDVHADKARLAYQMGASTFLHVNDGAWVKLAWMDGRKFDVILDTAGAAFTMEQALPLLAPSGRYIMVGQPRPGEGVLIDGARHMFDGEGKTIKATQGGGFRPDLDIPRYIALHRAGKLDVSKLITHRLPLSKINEAIALVQQGHAGRVLIQMKK